MQVWDQVVVTAAGEFEGKAGLVIRVDVAKELATVKLDEHPDAPGVFAFSELKLLGR